MINIVNKDNYKKYNVGTKAENLFRMQEENMKVPELVCIQGSTIEKEEDINSEIIDEILSCFLQDEVAFAVRSSSNMEDGKKISFAGQFDTYLNVTKEKLREAIFKCINSLKNSSAKEYCKYNHIEHEKLQMNVIVEKMINPEVSGILFSANPQGILNESVIVVGEGLGENVVNDLVPTTSYYYNLTDDLYYYESQENAKVIDDELVHKIIELAAEVKKTFGEYIDMEFGIINKELHILQVRNITTLEDKHPLILDNSNIVESYPGISLPLTASFVQVAYSGVFKGLAKRCLKDEKVLESYNDVFNNMVASVNGRMYYQINNLAFFGQWTALVYDSLDDITNNARNITPFSQSIETAADQNETLVFDEFIVGSGDVGLLVEHDGDLFGYIAEMDRRAVLPDDQESVITHALCPDVRRFRYSPIAEGILADSFEWIEPAFDHLLILVFF